MANSHVMYAWILEEQDRLAEALETVGRLRTLAGENAESPVAVQIERWRARAYFAAGRWDEALVELDSALRVYDAGVDVWPEAFALRALIAVHRGQLDSARADVAGFDAAIAAGGSCFVLDQPVLARALVLEADGQTAQAAQVLAAGWEIAEAAPLALAKPTIGPQLARLAVQAGDLAAAHRVAAALDALAAANPTVARLQAAARWATGIAKSDAGILLEAVKFQREAARPFDLAMVQEDAAAAMARDGQLDMARELLGQALAGYEELQASQCSAAARARLRALGLRPGSTGRRRRPALRPGRLDQRRASGLPAGRRPPIQSGDRRAPLRLPPDRGDPRVPRPGQARLHDPPGADRRGARPRRHPGLCRRTELRSGLRRWRPGSGGRCRILAWRRSG